jgi:hypothetical protein
VDQGRNPGPGHRLYPGPDQARRQILRGQDLETGRGDSQGKRRYQIRYLEVTATLIYKQCCGSVSNGVSGSVSGSGFRLRIQEGENYLQT